MNKIQNKTSYEVAPTNTPTGISTDTPKDEGKTPLGIALPWYDRVISTQRGKSWLERCTVREALQENVEGSRSLIQYRKTLYETHSFLRGKFKNELNRYKYSGEFRGSGGKDSFIPESCTNIFAFYIGGLDRSEIEELKQRLSYIPFVLFCYESCNSKGLEIGLHVPTFKNQADYEIRYKHVNRYFKDNLNLWVDESCKDITRDTYLSRDSDMYINESATMMDIEGLSPAKSLVEPEEPVKNETTEKPLDSSNPSQELADSGGKSKVAKTIISGESKKSAKCSAKRTWEDGSINIWRKGESIYKIRNGTVETVLREIAKSEYDEDVDKFREALSAGCSDDKLKKLKLYLTECIFAGKFFDKYEGGGFKPDSCTNVFAVYIDNLTPSEVADVKNKVMRLKTVLFCYEAYDGRGLEIGLHVPTFKDQAEYEIIYKSVKRYFKEKLKIKIDKSCKNISRKSYVSKDSYMYINELAKMMDIKGLSPVKDNIIPFKTNQSVEKSNDTKSTPDSKGALDDAALKQLVLDMNKEYAVVSLGGKTRVAKLMYNGTYNFQTFADFHHFFSNKSVTVQNGEKYTKVSKASIWSNSPERKEYSQGIEFYPTIGESDRDNGKLNVWSGFGYERRAYKKKRIQPILDYIKDIVCDGNDEYYRYVIGWIAKGFQKPHIPAGTAIVLRGVEGSGKSTLGLILATLWGNSGMMIEDSEHLTGKFNNQLMNCAFLAGNEAVYHGDKKAQSKLKALVTDTSLMIEGKGVDAIKIRNCLKIILSANDEWVVKTSSNQRRFFCLEVKNKFEKTADRLAYYNKLYKIIGDDESNRDHEAFSMLLDYFLTYSLKGFNHQDFPVTDESRNQRLHSLDWIPKFLMEVCERGFLFMDGSIEENLWSENVHMSVLKKSLDEWGRDNYRTGYDKVTYDALKIYFKAKLGFVEKPRKSTTAVVESKTVDKLSRGWHIGSPEELLKKVRIAENLDTPEDD